MTQIEGNVKLGWRGRFFGDFEVGDVYRSTYGRTVTELDNSLFTHLTLNGNPLHFDAEYTRQSQWERILVNSTFTLGLVTGMSVSDVSQNALANLGWENVRLPNPVFVGDTIYCETKVVGKRESRSHPEAGIVTVETRGINQDAKTVIEFTRNVMIYKEEHSPVGAGTFQEKEKGIEERSAAFLSSCLSHDLTVLSRAVA